jgi:hypothetical protein
VDRLVDLVLAFLPLEFALRLFIVCHETYCVNRFSLQGNLTWIQLLCPLAGRSLATQTARPPIRIPSCSTRRDRLPCGPALLA